jgi:phenylacetate-CoA ligase
VIECAEDLHAWPRLRGVAYRQSSASTGRPLRVAWDRVASAWNWANEYRGTLWHGIPIGIKTLMLWGFGSTLASWILNRKLYLTKNLTAAKLDEAARYLLNQHPRLIRGYPSAVAQVARYIGTNYPQAPRPVVPFVKVGGEQVFPFQIQEIERYLGARVVQSYGCSEAGSIAMQCSRGALHVFGLQTHVEIFREGEPAQPGELGEVVATSLTNRAMPLVRCRIGDRGRLSPEPCPCGLPYPVLTDLQGRTSDLFLAADGGKVHGSAIPRAMEAYIGIAPLGTVRQVLFQQIDQRSWKVLVENDIDPGEALRSQVSGIIRQNFGPDCRVETEVVSFIPREASGKFRYYRTATAAPYDQEKQV